MANLIDVTEDVRKVLGRYKKVSAEVAQRVEQGALMADALDAVQGPTVRREVTEALASIHRLSL